MPPLELTAVGELERMIAEGEQHVSFLYTYRSLFQPLGRARPKSEEVKAQFYHTICKTMHPAIMGLLEMTDYVTRAIERVKEVILAMSAHNDPAPRDLMMEKLLCLLDVLVVIDTTRASKACLQNDFSFYKRSVASLVEATKTAAGGSPQEFSIDPESQMKVAEFLQSSFFEPRGAQGMVPSLVGTIKDLDGFQHLITQLLRYAQKRYEDRYYVLPKEKWRLLRTMAVCLVTLGWTDENSLWHAKEAKTHIQREVKLDKILAHLREYPAIPMFGDMQLAPAALLKNSPYFAEMRRSKTSESLFVMPAEAHDRHLDNQLKANRLSSKVGQVRIDFDKYSATLSKLLVPINKFVDLGRPVPLPMAREMHEVMMGGVRYLTDWSEMVLKLAAYKYARPRQNYENKEGEADPNAYELAVRLNYSAEEKNEVVDMIGYIKGLASILKRAEKVVAGVLRMSIHRQVQEMVQHVLTDTVLREDKKERVK
eukprot:COSAG02_NODE_11418_length_1728_cov_1.585021_1_plen_481_part_01